MSKDKTVIFVAETDDLDYIAGYLAPYSESADDAKAHADSNEFAEDHDMTRETYIYKVTIERIATGKKIWEK